jgi:hypothetical protein
MWAARSAKKFLNFTILEPKKYNILKPFSLTTLNFFPDIPGILPPSLTFCSVSLTFQVSGK